MNTQSEKQQEWITLHQSYEQYEVLGLIIKIMSVILFCVSYVLDVSQFIIVLSLVVLWLQEGIWKTFQSRTEQRLLNIESNMHEVNNQPSFQFYSEWASKRPNTIGLIKEYISQALRPTVAFPYVVLVSVILFQQFV